MVVSTDVPEEIARKIDDLIIAGHPPIWPFSTKTVIPAQLAPAAKKQLAAYLEAKKVYDAAECDATALRSRSAVLRMIVLAYFNYKAPTKPITDSAAYQRKRRDEQEQRRRNRLPKPTDAEAPATTTPATN